MGYCFEFDEVNNVLRSTYDGSVTDELVWEAYASRVKFQAHRPAFRTLSDFSSVTTFDVSIETIKKLAVEEPVIAADSMRVIVAPSDLTYGLARMFGMLGEQTRPNVHVVRTMEEAYELLGIKSPQFSRVDIL
jgi:hypothetical protein